MSIPTISERLYQVSVYDKAASVIPVSLRHQLRQGLEIMTTGQLFHYDLAMTFSSHFIH